MSAAAARSAIDAAPCNASPVTFSERPRCNDFFSSIFEVDKGPFQAMSKILALR